MKSQALSSILLAALALLTGCVIHKGTVVNTTSSIVPMVVLTEDGKELRHDVRADTHMGVSVPSPAELRTYKALRFLGEDGTTLAELPLTDTTTVVIFDEGIYTIDITTWNARYAKTHFVGSFTQFLRDHKHEVISAKSTKSVYERRN